MSNPDSSPQKANTGPLSKGEIVWRDRYHMLESHGYRLRPRFRPNWKPSWGEVNELIRLHEDYFSNDSYVTIDAIRISDGRRVFLKRLATTSREIAILRFLSDKERLNDPSNHTAPLIDEFLDDEDTRYIFIVLPLLQPFFVPDFFSVDEVVDFIKQLLEGVVYMHKLDVAHRDCSDLNIMMDADKLYPKGFHPTISILDATGTRIAKPKRRRDVSHVRYYFIDFGISTRFESGESNKKVLGTQGQDDEVPELSEEIAYDPFLVDVFILGNLFRLRFFERYDNLGFLEPLIRRMTARSWMDRCSSGVALKLFNQIVSSQSWFTLRWRLRERSAGRATLFFQDVSSISQESISLAGHVVSKSTRNAIRILRRQPQEDDTE